MGAGEISVPTPAIWVRRVGVVALFGLAGLLIMGPSQSVLTVFVVPAILQMVWRGYQRTIAEARALKTGRAEPAGMSKRGYAIAATAWAGVLSLPLWLLCDKVLIAITLVPAIICVWFAVYLMRGT